ncbi:restriction endonuclease subunit S [Diaphorobacter sp.]|uniref:restriction endonuclease subunit S n=1 Tax=Diaphorobacter sp. TaxID=1934310 RepID=UPI00258FE108|nr:restriction endonuclease subunit S [Diaphorobacter sp.]
MLLSNMELLATAPGGVAKLRELILTLAVQGKLVPQDPADEPAGVLLQKIRAEKDRLVAEGKIKRDKPLAEIAEEEKPFELPVGWEWVRLPEIYYSISPSSNKLLSSAVEIEGRFPVVDQGQRPIAGYTNDRALLIEIPGPVIVFGDHTKAIKHIDFDFVAGADGTKILRPVLQDEKFFAFQLRGFDLEDRGYARHFKVLNAQLFALPPLAEQSRIVTRVEALMRLCDALEAKGQLEAAQHAQLVSTLLGTLTGSTTPEELADNWQRVAQHFDLLLDRPEAIDALEQTLLQLAVRGLLVPQDPTDEPASALLQKIRAEKDRLIATGQIKRDKPLPPITDEEKPFELPVGWEWVRFGDASINRDGERIPVSSSERENRAKVYDYYGASGVIDKIDGFLFDKTLLLIGEDGANLINRSTPIAFLAHGKYWVNNHAHVIDTTHPELMTYLALFINAISLEPYVTGTAQPKMNQAKLNSIVIALPPLPEQSRIVTRVTALRRLCADLRQRLAERQSVQARLAEALVQEVA